MGIPYEVAPGVGLRGRRAQVFLNGASPPRLLLRENLAAEQELAQGRHCHHSTVCI